MIEDVDQLLDRIKKALPIINEALKEPGRDTDLVRTAPGEVVNGIFVIAFVKNRDAPFDSTHRAYFTQLGVLSRSLGLQAVADAFDILTGRKGRGG